MPDAVSRFDPETGEVLPGSGGGDDVVGDVASAADYITDKNGYPVANAHNIVEFLTHDDEFAGLFATDTFANKRVLLRQLPNIRGPRTLVRPMVLTETHIAAILARVQRRLAPRATKAMICDALDVVFPRTTIHPVRNYLESLKWDGTPRVSSWLQTYLGANGDDDEMQYVSAVGRAWLVAAVARVMRAIFIALGHLFGSSQAQHEEKVLYGLAASKGHLFAIADGVSHCADGGLAVLHGNLAPEGCVVKLSGAETLLFEGPARVFEGEEACFAAVERGDAGADGSASLMAWGTVACSPIVDQGELLGLLLLAVGDRYEEQIARDRAADARYR